MIDADFLTATRVSYDAIADDFTTRFSVPSDDEGPVKPLEDAMLTAFAGLVRRAGAGPVADLGCGQGHDTARLVALGVDAFGIDLSPRMVAIARETHPGLRFEEGSMTDLRLPEGSLGGIVTLYSTIHIPPDHLPALFAGFHRVLAPGGYALLLFQVRDEDLHRDQAFGRPVTLDYYRRRPEEIAALLAQAGLPVLAQLVREPDDDGVETVPRATLIARKPPVPA